MLQHIESQSTGCSNTSSMYPGVHTCTVCHTQEYMNWYKWKKEQNAVISKFHSPVLCSQQNKENILNVDTDISLFPEKYQLILNLMPATHLKKVKVSGTTEKQLEEHFAAN